jgi:uncharacterized membrane protein (UPF0182 family)
VIGGVLVLIVVLGSLRMLAGLYTDSLWFASVGYHPVWSTLLAVKVGLFASFGAAFFVVLWLNLIICDRLAVHAAPSETDDVVRRYQLAVRPYAGRLYAALALAAALIAAATTIGQWNNWLLFTHAQPFPRRDPQFDLNDGFFVFRLPFLQFLVDWILATLVVVVLFVVVFHYLNGGIRPRSNPRVRSVVKVHLSVLLALIALTKAAGYVLSRYALDLSTNGYVEGAGYTAVHARLPALEVLFFVSLFAAVILLYNVRRQGWTLPVLAIGVWGFVALVIGVIYPAVLQVLKVNPAQSTLESKYISRNISATRYAYGLDHVKVSTGYADRTIVPTHTIDASLTTLTNIRLWDPSTQISLADFRTKQSISNYYTFQTVQVESYATHGTIRPDIVGVRQVDPTDLPSESWVNVHLQYTHGEGLVLAEANRATAKGNPVFAIKDVPAQSAPGFPALRQPAVYFGVKQPGYVIADTKQPELNGQRKTGTDVEGHYHGSGGVRLGSLLTRAAFALRLGDLNILLSNLITPDSRMMFIRDIHTMVEKVAPFLSLDSKPYPVLVDGQIDWILNAYTTTANFPYSQNIDTQTIPEGSGLPSSYNYVRNSVVVVVSAYTGKMTFYAIDNDPILRAYESAFPKLFTPSRTMPPSIRDQLRYGNDLFAAQAAIFARYHIVRPEQFYTAGDAWLVSPTTGVGSPTQPLSFRYVTNQQGQIVGGSYQPMTPVYQVESEPGNTTQALTVTDAYVPAGSSAAGDSQLLRALLVGDSSPGHFEQLHAYETAPGASKVGPIFADNEIETTPTVSSKITLLNKEGSRVVLGNILPVLVGDSVLYVRPLYVESKTVPQPQLKYVIAVLGQRVQMGPTIGSTLNALLGTSLKRTGGILTTTPNAPSAPRQSGSASSAALQKARSLLAQASADFVKAQGDLKSGNLGAFQHEIAAAQAAVAQADGILNDHPSLSKPSNGSTSKGAVPSAGAAATTTSAVWSDRRKPPCPIRMQPTGGAKMGAGGDDLGGGRWDCSTR